MSRCKWMTDGEVGCFGGICVNGECQMCADYCPLPGYAEFCMYSTAFCLSAEEFESK